MAPSPSKPVSLEEALAWIDANTAPLASEDVPLASAPGRILARPVAALAALPPFDRAAGHGLAVRARDTIGASIYNPLSFALAVPGEALQVAGAMRIEAGDPLPGGADAILPLDHASLVPAAGRCDIVEPAIAGNLVERAGSHAPAGAVLLPAGRRLRAVDIGLMAVAGHAALPVIRRPVLHILIACPPSIGDADGPMLQVLAARDGAIATEIVPVGRDRAKLLAALGGSGADIILVAGGTGEGADDLAAAALAAAGELALHGLALEPGRSAGMGRLAAGPLVFLLPGAPVACLWAYELLAGRAVRRMGRGSAALPFPGVTLRLQRKIVSRIGVTEICPLRVVGREAAPVASFAEAGLVIAAEADGFALIPEGSEGFPEGAMIEAHLYEAPMAASA